MKNILLLITLFSMSTFAKNHMLTGSSRSAYNYNTDSGSSFTASVGYYHSISPTLQTGLDASISLLSGPDIYTILPGVILNFSEDINSSKYFKVNAGIVDFDSIATELLLQASFGKRYPITENIVWSPSVQISSFPGVENSDPTLSIKIFKIDLFF